ncbi:hypothetical protein PP175_29250 (plasmid) [Aneurinibacillus sp. Ricciae_BoGa-3]|uniref:hypothetical protein n=1 Tax=Aneurinibacillus sp. Ricciae_BoGa-3 TaxID=3022697 RepID=UPI002341B145|nr:hypothetical protein [Aneurinibacillus sp. Ricciae_BoGa-3]WCK57279.1 hypothetical protein PP175_29250 [Aneurinibacillus sp. Ricciae_BoGa-3]
MKNMKKVFLPIVATIIGATLFSVGCSTNEIQVQQEQKVQNAIHVFEQTKVPQINKSLERENIRQRILVSNDPNTLMWIYPMSAGRVIGRFPVKGKVTSGGKRLTATTEFNNAGNTLESPDEMGTYGASGDYIFWFDPAGRYHQHKGDYFLSPVPYKIDLGYGTISTEVDQSEDSKRSSYNNQIRQTNAKLVQQEEPSTPTVVMDKGAK